MQTIKILYDLLSNNERKQALVLLIMILIMALFDMIGIASIMPFIAILTNPTLIETNEVLSYFYNLGKFNNYNEFYITSGLLVIGLLCLSLAFKALTIYTQLRFALMREYSIGKKLIEGYLNQPYSWFLNRHSANLGKNILSEVGNVISGGMMPMMTLIAQSSVALSIFALLLIIDPKLSIVVAFVLGVSYTLIYKFVRSFLDRIGKERLIANKDRFNSVSEAFGAVKEVKVSGLEKVYLKRFSDPAKIYASNQATAQVITQIPRFALEAIAFGGLLSVIIFLISKSQNFTSILPILSLFAFAGYRLLPAFQQIYASLTQIKFAEAPLKTLHADFMNLKINKFKNSKKVFSFTKDIKLENISFAYPKANTFALNQINLILKQKKTIGFVGTTGSGKTTIVDIILGLLDPSSGSLKVDNNIVNNSNKRLWQSIIGYVPQSIYLIDDTIEANIAFGVKENLINSNKVKKVSKIANLHNFIIDELPNGYQTKVGDKGIRLSGGQKQRIGIARALYNNPKVLIFDEATSALDNITEGKVMEAVYRLSKEMTIIIIAHRLTSIKKCDAIFHIQNGSVRSSGTYDELLKSDTKFKKMAIGK